VRYETFITYSNLRGTSATLDEFHDRIARYDRRQLLWLCTAISFSLDFVVKQFTEEAHANWVSKLFPAPEANWILNNKANVFHRHLLLYMIQEVCRLCPEIGEFPGPELPLQELGELFLMANDQLNAPVPEPAGDRALDLIAMLVPVNEANQITNAILKMGRGHLIVTEIAEGRRAEKSFFDIRDLFEKASGISYASFEALMTVVFTRLINVREVMNDASKFGLDESYFPNLRFPPGQVERFLSLVSSTPEELRNSLALQNPRRNDFRIIRDKPLIRIGTRYLPLDAHIGFEKFDSAVYWSILRSLPEDRAKVFPAFWGQVFEDYVSWLFKKTANEEINQIFPNPRYTDNPDQQVCDLIVLCDRTAIFVEVKGNMITSEAKYSGDLGVLKCELDLKWVDKRKGVAQLVSAINAVCADKDPRKIDILDMQQVSTVIPLIITRDDFGGYMGVNTYLNNRFREILGKARYARSITPLLCICADTLEKLSPYLVDTRLSEVLSVRLRGDKKLSSPFFADVAPYMRRRDAGKPDRQPTVLKEATFAVTRAAADALGLKPAKPAKDETSGVTS